METDNLEKKEKNNNLPWVEKYRPTRLDDIISHKEIINTLTNSIQNDKIPHMIFYGPPGTGKTTTILACAKEIYGPNYKSMILELNGSDDRGINVVREQIKSFSAADSKISNILVTTEKYANKKNNIKLVILDEADAMTYDAQFALRRVVESYTDSTRFCLICNYLTKIIPALQSRCQMFRFAPIGNAEHISKIDMIIENENININQDAITKIVELSEGDMRKSINLLQSLYMMYGTNKSNIDLDIIYKTIGHPTDAEKNRMIINLKGHNLNQTYHILNQIQIENNLSNQDIIREISNYYAKTYIDNYKKTKESKMKPNQTIRLGTVPQNKLLDLFDGLGKIEVNLANNTNNNIQLLAISSVINNYNSE